MPSPKEANGRGPHLVGGLLYRLSTFRATFLGGHVQEQTVGGSCKVAADRPEPLNVAHHGDSMDLADVL